MTPPDQESHRTRVGRRVVIVAVVVVIAVGLGGLVASQRAERPAPAEPSAHPASPDPGSEVAPGPVLSPERFGAEGDGVTDDSAALQEAVDQAARRGGRVRLLKGHTYLSTRSIRLPSHTFLMGSGSSSVLRFSWSENRPDTDGFYLGNSHQVGGDSDIVIRSLAIRGAGSGLPSGPNSRLRWPVVPGIRLRDVTGFRISAVEVSHVAGISILYQGSSDGVIVDNHVQDSGRDGITGTSLTPTRANIVVADNLIERVGDDGVAVIGAVDPGTGRGPAQKVVVRSNRIRGWSRNPNGLQLGRGIAVLALHRALVIDNHIDRTKSAGILVTDAVGVGTSHHPHRVLPADGIGIVDNVVVRAGSSTAGTVLPLPGDSFAGIDVVDAARVVLRGNRVSQSTGSELRVRRCAACVVRD